jgi:DNA-binding response OmpR family regulator
MPVLHETKSLKHVASDDLSKQGLRVLIVDDCRDYALSLGLICRLWGHPAECCFDGASALLAAQWFDPQIFLIDVAMPRMSGYDLVAELRKDRRFQSSLFVGVSGYADEAHRARGLNSGFDHYLVKPVDFQELHKLLGSRDRQRPVQALPIRSLSQRRPKQAVA